MEDTFPPFSSIFLFKRFSSLFFFALVARRNWVDMKDTETSEEMHKIESMAGH